MVLETPPPGAIQPKQEATTEDNQRLPSTLRYFGDYVLEAEIGRGGMGIVYRARQLRLNRTVAIKLIAPEQVSAPKALARFRAEAESAANLDHPNIVPVYETGEYEGRHYFSMKLIEGASLAAKIAEVKLPLFDCKSGRVPTSGKTQSAIRQLQIARLMAKVAGAVHYAHQRGILHRDLKPGNILIDAAGEPHVSDFGLAKRVDGNSSLTLSGEMLGTPAYMAPEQALGKGAEMTVAADVHSLGAILFELLTGQPPFARATPLETIHAILNDSVRAPRSMNQAVAKDLETICLKCLEKEPTCRYSTAAELAEELVRFVQGEPILARPITQPEQLWRWARRRPTLATLLLLLHVVFLAGLAGILWQWGRAEVNARKARANEFTARQNLYAADMNLAQQALQADNFLQAKDLLRKHVPGADEADLRGFEWRYLWKQSQGVELYSLPGHTNTSRALAFLPGGKALVTACDDGTATVWDLSTRQAITSLVHCEPGKQVSSTGQVETVCCSPNGQWVVTGSRNELCVWNAQTFRPLQKLRQPALEAKFSPDSQWLAVHSTNLTIISTSTWQPVAQIPLPGEWSQIAIGVSLSFSPDGQSLAVVQNDGVHVMALPHLEETVVLREPMPQFRFVVFGPDGRTLATCTFGHDVKIWDWENRKELRRLSGHSDNITAAAFSKDGENLITASLDQTIKMWDVRRGRLVRTFRGHAQEVWDANFSLDAQLLASVSKDGAVKIWAPMADPPPETLPHSVTPIGFTADGDVMCVKWDGYLIRLDPATLRTISADSFHQGGDEFRTWSSRLLQDGRTMVLHAAAAGSARVVDLEERKVLCTVDCHSPSTKYIAFAPRRKILATRTRERTVTLWQLPSGRALCVLSNTLVPLEFSPDERSLVTVQDDHMGAVLTMTGENWSAPPRVTTRVPFQNAAAFSPDGQSLASAEWPSLVSLYALPSGGQIGALVGHKREMCDLCFSPDGKTLATISDDSTVRLWQVATRREVMRFSMPLRDPRVHRLLVQFSPDGRTLLAVGDDLEEPVSRIWHAPSFAEIAVAEGRDFRPLIRSAGELLAVGKALLKQNRPHEALVAFQEAIDYLDPDRGADSIQAAALRYHSNLLTGASH